MSGVTAPQPAPLVGTQEIAPLILQDIAQRVEQGEAKYGTTLQSFNGRVAMIDLYQELIDACFYIRQHIAEEESGSAIVTREWLKNVGFREIHMNPNWNGGYFRYVLPLPQSGRQLIEVDFGSGLGDNQHGFSVWFSYAYSTRNLIAYAVTVGQIDALCRMVCGVSITDAAKFEFGEKE